MNPSHRLNQPPVSRLGRTGLIFLGSIALGSHPLPSLQAQTKVTPSTSQSTGSDQPHRRAGDNYRQGAGAHEDTRFLTDVESILRRQSVLSEQALSVDGPAADFAREFLPPLSIMAGELSALATKLKVKLAATADGSRAVQPRFDPRAPDFAQKYFTQLEQDQARALELFRTAAQHSQDEGIREFARRHMLLQEQRLARLRAFQHGGDRQGR